MLRKKNVAINLGLQYGKGSRERATFAVEFELDFCIHLHIQDKGEVRSSIVLGNDSFKLVQLVTSF